MRTTPKIAEIDIRREPTEAAYEELVPGLEELAEERFAQRGESRDGVPER